MIWLHNGLIQLDSVLLVDVFYKPSVGVIVYASAMTTDELLKVVQKIGKEACHYYGAEIIGQLGETSATFGMIKGCLERRSQTSWTNAT